MLGLLPWYTISTHSSNQQSLVKLDDDIDLSNLSSSYAFHKEYFLWKTVLHVPDIQPVLINNCLLSFLTAAARSSAAVLCALLLVMPRFARAVITPGKTNAAAGTDIARIAPNTNTFPPIQIAPKARVQVFEDCLYSESRIMTKMMVKSK